MRDASQDDDSGAKGGVLVEGPTSERAPASATKGWGNRPATGRSFLTMMVLAVLATGVALFVALRVQTEPDTEQSKTAVPGNGRNVP
jgi:hypothetical protein